MTKGLIICKLQTEMAKQSLKFKYKLKYDNTSSISQVWLPSTSSAEGVKM